VLEDDKRYNSVFVIQNNELLKRIDKEVTSNNFLDLPYFQSGQGIGYFSVYGTDVCVFIGDDGPSASAKTKQAGLIIRLFNPVFELGGLAKQQDRLSAFAKRTATPVVSLSQLGANTDVIYQGASTWYDQEGLQKGQLASFAEDVQSFDLQNLTNQAAFSAKPTVEIAAVHDALVLGIRDYFSKLGFKKAVLGLSGGIDSAVVCALACEALGAEHVLGILMPSKYSSDHSVEDANRLAENLKCPHQIIPIKEAADAFDAMLAPAFAGLSFDLTEENIQARCRAVIVMAMANKFGRILLNTSNKSEGAVGYGTLYGDLCGALSPLGDLYKTQVYQLARYINRNGELIPENTINKAPSAELRPGQKDSDSLPEYDVLDKILYQIIELRQDCEAVIAQGFDADLVKRVFKMLHNAQFKRHQVAPILKISTRSFGSDWHFPIVSKLLV
jgi:NAD+ synthase (glutamine-hydrolysing)